MLVTCTVRISASMWYGIGTRYDLYENSHDVSVSDRTLGVRVLYIQSDVVDWVVLALVDMAHVVLAFRAVVVFAIGRNASCELYWSSTVDAECGRSRSDQMFCSLFCYVTQLTLATRKITRATTVHLFSKCCSFWVSLKRKKERKKVRKKWIWFQDSTIRTVQFSTTVETVMYWVQYRRVL